MTSSRCAQAYSPPVGDNKFRWKLSRVVLRGFGVSGARVAGVT